MSSMPSRTFEGPFTPDLVGAIIVHRLCPKCLIPGARIRSEERGEDLLHIAVCDRCSVEWRFSSAAFARNRAADVLPADRDRLGAEITGGIGAHRRRSCPRCQVKLPEPFRTHGARAARCAACGFRIPLGSPVATP